MPCWTVVWFHFVLPKDQLKPELYFMLDPCGQFQTYESFLLMTVIIYAKPAHCLIAEGIGSCALEIETQTTCRHSSPIHLPHTAKDVHGYPEIISGTYNIGLWFPWQCWHLFNLRDGWFYYERREKERDPKCSLEFDSEIPKFVVKQLLSMSNLK